MDAKKYIFPQKNFADVIINFFPTNSFIAGNKNAKIDIGLKITFDANINVDEIIKVLDNNFFIWDYASDLSSQYIILKKIPSINFETLAFSNINNLNEISDYNAHWAKGYDGLLQYLLLKIISEKLKDN